MFENAELGHAVDKATYTQELPALRAALLEAQRRLAGAGFSVLVTVAGVPAAGKSETVNQLLEWLDARGVQTHALREPTDEERARPPLWRFWRALPAHGAIGIFFGGWELRPLLDRVAGRISRGELDRQLGRFVEFERMLARENVLLVKLWLHLSRPALKKRLKKLRRDPDQRWRVTPEDRRLYRRYDEFRAVSEHVLRRTSTGEASWVIVEGSDRRYRHLTAARTLLQALSERLAREAAAVRPARQPLALTPPVPNVIAALDLGRSLAEPEYEKRLAEAQGELGRLTRQLGRRDRSLVLVFEGPDAAGKGGAIRRLTAAMDARDYRVISVAAPTDEERAHPYLWRFWRQVPPRGKVTICDRSWYGRVLVERIEGFATPEQWQRAYEEINAFEEQLAEAGTVLLKFWLAISPEEQLRRFTNRETTPYKQYKLTAEDWRNRARWDSYIAAACDMIEKTSTAQAPWVLVEADNKEHARVKVIETVVGRLREAMTARP